MATFLTCPQGITCALLVYVHSRAYVKLSRGTVTIDTQVTIAEVRAGVWSAHTGFHGDHCHGDSHD